MRHISLSLAKKKHKKKRPSKKARNLNRATEKPDADSQRRVWGQGTAILQADQIRSFVQQLLRGRFTFNCERQSRQISPGINVNFSIRLHSNLRSDPKKAMKGLKSARLHKPLSLCRGKKKIFFKYVLKIVGIVKILGVQWHWACH